MSGFTEKIYRDFKEFYFKPDMLEYALADGRKNEFKDEVNQFFY